MLISKEKIKFLSIKPYIHSYYIPNLHTSMLKYKNFFIEEHRNKDKQEIYEGISSMNVLITNDEVNSYFDQIFLSIVKSYYIIDERFWGSQVGAYIQDDENSAPYYHQHENNAMVAITYIDPPSSSEGGELEVWKIPLNPERILPEKDVVYIIPGWLLHRPLPQKSKKKRVSLNWGYDASKRPIHKLTGDRW